MARTHINKFKTLTKDCCFGIIAIKYETLNREYKMSENQKKQYNSNSDAHWSGEEGDAWQRRCHLSDKLLASRISLYASVLQKTSDIRSVFEFGPAAGHSLLAVKTLLPDISYNAMEINTNAAKVLKENIPSCEVTVGSLTKDKPPSTYDFVFTCGLLVCIEGKYLPIAYDNIHSASNRYIGILEYYNPTPLEIIYRGKSGLLFKRDFAGEMMDKYSDLKLVDYGFVYHRDPNFPSDDINWFLLEKR